MFSVENFYYVLYTNLLKPVNVLGHYFYPFGATSIYNLTTPRTDHKTHFKNVPNCLFYDQEPLIEPLVNELISNLDTSHSFTPSVVGRVPLIFASSEHSNFRSRICKQHNFLDWYFFFHGFAALDWYRDYQYVNVEKQFTKVFITYNRLVTKDRSYRLTMISKFLEKDLVKYGAVSLILSDKGEGTWQDELTYADSKLSPSAKVLIQQEISKLPGSLVIDNPNPPGQASANLGQAEMEMNASALWHVVTETVFYYDKLHLTEKVFKPITSKRPFILVAAPGNLAYIKSYGFKTFDRWIDESYDLETDPDLRLDMITAQVEKLCALSLDELRAMHREMQEVLDFNHQHFFGDFKKIIVDELVDNFANLLPQWNNGLPYERQIPLDAIDYASVKKRFIG